MVGGLYAPGGGIIEPYRFVFALVESARKNGTEVLTNFKVINGVQRDDYYEISADDGRIIKSKWVINAAGLFCDDVSKAFKAENFEIKARKGEEFLLDKNSSAYTSKVVFPAPSKKSKGMLVIPTVEKTTMVGPTAEMVEDKKTAVHQRKTSLRSSPVPKGWFPRFRKGILSPPLPAAGRRWKEMISISDLPTRFPGLFR